MTSFGNVPCDPSGVNCTATFADALYIAANPIARHTAISGWAGWGPDFSCAYELLPSIGFAVLIYTVRLALRRPLMVLGLRAGVKRGRALDKFQNQTYLAMFYIISSLFGYYVLHDKPYARFPLRSTDAGAAALFVGYPQRPSLQTLFYYNYELGFYLNEIYTLFLYGRRTDFLEMFTHHVAVFVMVGGSHLCRFHRLGTYIFFIHDASDIMLSVSKVMLYLSAPSWMVTVGFVLFVSAFVFFRLYVFPLLVPTGFVVAARTMPCTYAWWVMMVTFHVVLQSLHVYWFALIVRMALRLFGEPAKGDGQTKDVRSSDEDD